MRIESPDIKEIFNKPGEKWELKNRVSVKEEWVFAKEGEFINEKNGYCKAPCYEYLFHYIFRVAPGMLPENNTDILHDFSGKLDQIIDKYDPSKGRRFWSYILYRLEWFARDQRRKLFNRYRSVVSQKTSSNVKGSGQNEGMFDPDDPAQVNELVKEELDEKGRSERILVADDTTQVEEMEGPLVESPDNSDDEQIEERRSLADIIHDDPAEAIDSERLLDFVRISLPPKLHNVIDLFYWQEKSIKEASSKLNITEGTSKIRLYRARLTLKECLKEYLAKEAGIKV